MSVALPEIGSLWHFPPWTNAAWSGPWRVVEIREARENESEYVGTHVFLERVDGKPERWSDALHAVPLTDAIVPWPHGWEPWPSVPDFPPS